MATDGSDFVTELTEAVLCCQICMEDFDTKTRVPRVLPCHHAFCAACLQALGQQGRTSCPNCREEFPGQGAFPVEITRMAILELKQAKQNKKAVLCQGCEEGTRAMSRCRDCEELLCEDCSVAHARVKYTKHHVLVPLAEEAKVPGKLLNSTELCDHHKDEKIKLYCKSCSECVCSMCALTLHKKCEELVGVGTILHEKTEEMRCLCKELDEMQGLFQEKAHEAEGSVKTSEANLLRAVQLVEGAFSEVIQSAVERQEEVLRDLRVRARCDQLLLEQQTATFHALQAEAQTSAQSGRQCAALQLAAQICGQLAQLKEALSELRAMTKTQLKPAPDYEVTVEKVAEVKEMMGQIGCTRIESQPVLNPSQDLASSLLSFQLDASRCGAGCWVEEDRCSLNNRPRNVSSQRRQQGFPFPGTCGTVALQCARIYWQVRFQATPRLRYKDNDILLEVGVATMLALQSCPGDRLISCGPHTAFTAVFYTVSGMLRAVAFYKNSDLLTTDGLQSTVPHSSVDLTLGFLMDTDKSRLHVIDAKAATVLWCGTICGQWPVCCQRRREELTSEQSCRLASRLPRLGTWSACC